MSNSIEKLVKDQLDNIEKKLGQKRVREVDRLSLETQKIILYILLDDHPRVVVMWQWFRPMAWAMGIAVAALLTMAATGHLMIQVIP